MGLWLEIGLISAAIWVFAVLFARVALRLPWAISAIAITLTMPVPLYQIGGGPGSWIFPADILAILFVVAGLLKLLPEPDPSVRQQTTLLIFLALAITVILPMISTVIGFGINEQPRLFKFILLPLFRGIGYFVMFRTFLLRMRHVPVDRFLLAQCVSFILIYLCGCAQYYLGVNLDLVQATRSVGEEIGRVEFGGGFMGLYRGAVGAWAVGILGMLPIMMASRPGWNLFLPVAAAVVLGGVLGVGSRQGLAIGVVAFAIGFFQAIRTGVSEHRLKGAFWLMVTIFVLIPFTMFAWSKVSSGRMGQFIEKRFELVFDLEKLGQAALSRDPKYPRAWANITDNIDVLLVGTGYGVEYISPTPGGRIIELVDSELLCIWQVGGTPLIVSYLGFLLLSRLKLRTFRWPLDPAGRCMAAVGVVTLYGGIMLMWGHFFLLTPYFQQAPISYWQWSVLGLAIAACSGQQGYLWPAQQGSATRTDVG